MKHHIWCTNARCLKRGNNMTVFELILKKISIDVMADMLDACNLESSPFCTAHETADGDLVCDKENCKQCIKEWLQSEVREIP